MRSGQFIKYVFLSVLLIISYQNCGEELGDLNDKTLTSSGDEIEFPYEFSLDTIAHMSCSGNQSNPNDFFSFKILSTGSASGARISRVHMNKSLEAQKKLIAESNKLKNASLQFSIREVDFPRNMPQWSSTGYQTSDLLGVSLGEYGVSGVIPYQSVYNMNGVSAKLDLRSSNFQYPDGGSNHYMDLLQSNMLSLNLNVLTNGQASGPYLFGNKNNINIYGNTYKLEFSHTGALPLNRLTTIREYSLLNEKVDLDLTERANSWICENYMIVRVGDEGIDNCSGGSSYKAISGYSSDQKIKRLYKVLGNGWSYVQRANSNEICIKHTSKKGCYQEQQNGVPLNVSYSYQLPCGEGEQKLCPEFLSVCTKAIFDRSYDY